MTSSVVSIGSRKLVRAFKTPARFVAAAALSLSLAGGAACSGDSDPMSTSGGLVGTWDLTAVDGDPLPSEFETQDGTVEITAGQLSVTTGNRYHVEMDFTVDGTPYRFEEDGDYVVDGSTVEFNPDDTNDTADDIYVGEHVGSRLTISDVLITNTQFRFEK
jgi:hypothetical protein